MIVTIVERLLPAGFSALVHIFYPFLRVPLGDCGNLYYYQDVDYTDLRRITDNLCPAPLLRCCYSAPQTR